MEERAGTAFPLSRAIGLGVGAVNGGMTAGRPAGAEAQQRPVIDLADPDLTRGRLDLGMAFQAEVGVAFGDHLGVDRTVGRMAAGAAFAQRLVLEHERPGLLAVAGGALVVQARHGQVSAPRRLETLAPMRVVALDAVHLPLRNRMMLRQPELQLDVEMAGVARGRARFLLPGLTINRARSRGASACRLPGP